MQPFSDATCTAAHTNFPQSLTCAARVFVAEIIPTNSLEVGIFARTSPLTLKPFSGQAGAGEGVTGIFFLSATFPLKWMTQGIRSVFLPDSFATQEAARSWESGKTFAIILAWLVIGLFFAIRKFKWERE